tara:strand:+ start:1337 stop:2464 length:1128 start_codon:yes stop_codon:yes gene_type:complete
MSWFKARILKQGTYKDNTGVAWNERNNPDAYKGRFKYKVENMDAAQLGADQIAQGDTATAGYSNIGQTNLASLANLNTSQFGGLQNIGQQMVDRSQEFMDPTSNLNVSKMQGAQESAMKTASASALGNLRASAAMGGSEAAFADRARQDVNKALSESASRYLDTVGRSQELGFQGLGQAGSLIGQSQQQRLQSNLAQFQAGNQMSQFNVGAQNQMQMSQAQMNQDVNLANMAAQNSMAQFNAGQTNQINLANLANQQAANQFNAANQTAANLYANQGANQAVYGSQARDQQTWNQGIQLAASVVAMSDINYKENISKIGNLDTNGLPIYSFNYKGDNKTQIGLMAQDVEKLIPDAVLNINGIKYVNYNKATQEVS